MNPNSNPNHPQVAGKSSAQCFNVADEELIALIGLAFAASVHKHIDLEDLLT